MTTISDNLQAIRDRVDGACRQAGRPASDVQVLAVSKTFGPEAVQEAVAAGQRLFGENYVQEGLDKLQALRVASPQLALEWHCIGPIQSNKTRLVATHFDWVHTIDRLKIAQRLSEQRPPGAAPLQVCLQVNIDEGANKSGIAPQDLAGLAQAVAALPNLRLRGLMSIPEPSEDAQTQRALFRRVKSLYDQLNAHGFSLDTLSMGMSDDLEAAIAEGSTLVRVGRAIFGHRPRKDSLTSSAAGSA